MHVFALAALKNGVHQVVWLGNKVARRWQGWLGRCSRASMTQSDHQNFERLKPGSSLTYSLQHPGLPPET